ncbi:ATP-binding protein [Columbia Basin potato purple top phytoplasma]|uniref:ATP-binding protein n=1 Tax=Columbia Basin potato purple top phytoplasma TaxID=307134 RepID=A0ABT5L882_9MOLU|nr:ATP-binding protein [Columbia Basin potato purple top phytoplasma]MDC9031885.1 ATP-binding protein [Columbia Basin potato purple top phytoplasma]
MCLSKKLDFNKIKHYVQQHEETKNLKIKDEDIITVYNYLKNKNKKNSFGYQMVLKTKPYVSVIYKETTESKKINLENNLYQKNILFNQNLNFDNIELKNFQTNNSISKKEVLKKIKNIIKNFSQMNKSLYLYGKFGTGKTFILKSLAKSLIQKNIPVLFIFMPDLTRQFKNTWNNNDILENKLNYLKNSPCLILDDLGSENMNIFFRDDIFLPLLYYRYEHKLPIFFSSNFNEKQLLEYFDSYKDLNHDIKAFKIIRIIKQLADFYNFDI